MRHSKNKTFKTKSAAKAWGDLKVKEIESSIAIGTDVYSIDNPIKTLGDLIEAYLNDKYVSAGRSKRMALIAMSNCDITAIDVKKNKTKALYLLR